MMHFTPVQIKPRNGSHVETAEQQAVSIVPEDYSGNRIRSAGERLDDARNLPEVKRLFSVIWQSNELHLMFADTGIGKSILAVALADALSKGESLLFQDNDHDPLNVLYYDFELSDRQFRNRYSDEQGDDYHFSSRFYIDTIDFAALLLKHPGRSMNDLLFRKIRHDLTAHPFQVLIIDNLTYLSTLNTQDTQVALEVMRKLTELKNEFELSILVLAHTPKRSMSNPITINDLAGSKHLSNFADSVSAIGKSVQGKSVRYIKQVKPSRSSEILYDADNVICCEIEKPGTMLTFHHLGYSPEYEHLNHESAAGKEDLKNRACELKGQRMTVRDIANQLDVPSSTVHRWIKSSPEDLSHSGQAGQVEQNGTDETCPF